MARQRFLGGGWLSKVGSNGYIVHGETRDIYCITYGTVAQYRKRSCWTSLKTFCLFRFWRQSNSDRIVPEYDGI
jgi:hypothetical protein